MSKGIVRRYLHRYVANIEDRQEGRKLLAFKTKVFFEPTQSCSS